MYVDLVAKGMIAKIHTISHLNLRHFIISEILNIGFFIYLYNDLVILRIVWFICYEINTSFDIIEYFKTQD